MVTAPQNNTFRYTNNMPNNISDASCIAKLIGDVNKDWKRICLKLTSGPQQTLSLVSNLCSVSWVLCHILSRAGIFRYLRMLILCRKCYGYSYGHINTIIISSDIIRCTKLSHCYFCTATELVARFFWNLIVFVHARSKSRALCFVQNIHFTQLLVFSAPRPLKGVLS